MTAHLVMPSGEADDALLQAAARLLHDGFGIEHAALQVVRVPFTRPCATQASSDSDAVSGAVPQVAHLDDVPARVAPRGPQHV